MYPFIMTLIFMILYLDDYDIVTSIYDIHKQYIFLYICHQFVEQFSRLTGDDAYFYMCFSSSFGVNSNENVSMEI